MSDFKKLAVWQKAHAFSGRVHHAAQKMRGWENATLRSQLARAAESIPANIVEGRAAASEVEFARFLGFSIRSAAEVEHHLMTARERGIMTQSDFVALRNQLFEVRRMLYGLLKALRKKS
jgi:four helix bundle protein